jgi:uncharacterized protein with HEPN domain
MRPEDRIRLEHMLESAHAIAQVVRDRSREDLDTDLLLRLAVVRAIEILGEAASRLSAEARAEMPEIPWASIVGMRNRLSHAYFDIDYDIVWRTATVEIPGLTPVLREALGASPNES